MSNAAARLIHLILLLQRRPNQKAADLAAELEVSVRTLHRYLAQLDEMGIPIYAERGPLGGFSLVRGYKMPPLVFTPEEAVAVSLGINLAAELWGRLYREAARSALAKIDNLLPEEQRQEAAWARRALAASISSRADVAALTPQLETLRQAAHDYRRVRLVYQTAGRPGPNERVVDPYALAYRYGWWYLVGFCHLRRDLRVFRLDRIQRLELLPERFEPPTAFDLHAFLAANFQNPPQMRARLRFAADYAHVARSPAAAWESMEEQPDGAIIVVLAAPDLLYAASTALAYGPIVEVVDPLELRREVQAWALATAQQYMEADISG